MQKKIYAEKKYIGLPYRIDRVCIIFFFPAILSSCTQLTHTRLAAYVVNKQIQLDALHRL
jgi:hypothetical protein